MTIKASRSPDWGELVFTCVYKCTVNLRQMHVFHMACQVASEDLVVVGWFDLDASGELRAGVV